MQLETQKALRTALTYALDVEWLVPASAIFDTNARPSARPCIIIGEAETLNAGLMAQDVFVVNHTLHVWTQEIGTEQNKRITGAIINSIPKVLDVGPDAHCGSLSFVSARTLRDPDGESVHGVLTLQMLVQRVAT